MGGGKQSELPDFGFHHADDLELVIELSHVLRTYNVLPEAGGWLDQDSTLTDDMLTWESIVGHVEAEKQDGASDPFKDVAAKDGDLDMMSLMP